MPDPSEQVTVALWINGRPHQVALDASTTLLDLLRDELELYGTKKGCETGACGACTVLADGRRINACLALAAAQEGREIITIEGIAEGGELHELQAAFAARDALQCGYCTPGQIMSALGLIAEGRAGDDDTIREFMSGNLCRCGAHPSIIAAIGEALRP